MAMPFKSKAQRRKFAELLVKGEISEETFEEWNRSTGSRKLPERVKPKKQATGKKKAARTKKKATRRSSRKKAARRYGVDHDPPGAGGGADSPGHPRRRRWELAVPLRHDRGSGGRAGGRSRADVPAGPTLGELADLPEGWRATRSPASGAWQRGPA